VDANGLDRSYRLDDRYAKAEGRVFLTGTQALVRLMLEQAAADRAAGFNTAGFVSGYRGSPLGGVDQEFWKAQALIDAVGVRFQPAINEDLAATAILGTQQVGSDPGAMVEGVFALWYGKGPGVDRSGDALRHGNAYGSSPRGGVLVVAGDDHGCVSSSMSHQSDHALMAWSMPVLHPASVADYVPFGLYGFALSRFSGAWVGFKAISETVESSASVLVGERPAFTIPADYTPPAGGLHYRWPDLPSPRIEQRLTHKLAAVRAFARANPIDRLVVAPARPRLLIAALGKAFGDVMEALRAGGFPAERLAEAGVAVVKIGLVFPVSDFVRELAAGVEEVLVVEEKGPVVETQLKELLYNLPTDRRPRILGKRDEGGAPLIATDAELRPSRVAPALAQRLARLGLTLDIPPLAPPEPVAADHPARSAYFCSGCPHNISTKVPEGSEAFAGIGCHFMASWMDRDTGGITQMGGEGVNWAGRAPFTGNGHVFQNLGDGTYFHSGHLAIRQAVSAGVNITYKILFNDAVAMTGGQPIDGMLDVAQITRLVAGEGVKRIAVVSDEPEKYAQTFAPGVTVHHRDDLDVVQRELREVPGVSVLVYDQTCAAEKRRRRKKGLYPDPPKRVVINELVCEGCGDCQQKSNCLSIVPVETEFGRKRQIDQSSCNKDFSCLNGFCPSFVTVEGGALRKHIGADIAADELFARAASLPEPAAGLGREPFEIVVAGIGGTGVVTIGAIIAMAAHLEGHAASVLDFMGFAQKGGQVLSHVRLARDPAHLHQTRIDQGRANAIIACDLVVATSRDGLGLIAPDKTRIVANTREIPTGAMLRKPDAKVETGLLEALIKRRLGDAGTRAPSPLAGEGREGGRRSDSELRSLSSPAGAERRGRGSRVAQVVGVSGSPSLPRIKSGFAGDDSGRASPALHAYASIDAHRLAERLVGDAIQANMLILGFAWQGGLVPVSLAAIEQAIGLNGVAVDQNRRAFAWGRLAAGDPGFVAGFAGDDHGPVKTLDEIVARRVAFLTAYQDAAYAERYRRRIETVREVERRALGSEALAAAVAKNLFKLMAYKDEYEVARLYTEGSFAARLAREFEGEVKLTFHLAPPLLSRPRPGETEPRKQAFGRWMLPVFRSLAKLKRLRGTKLDPFGYTAERRAERQLIADYEAMLDDLLPQLGRADFDTILALARLPESIRGFGPVKERAIAAADLRKSELSTKLRESVPAAA
jgi:indolepyruvate ferredoxin oxidoreductase